MQTANLAAVITALSVVLMQCSRLDEPSGKKTAEHYFTDITRESGVDFVHNAAVEGKYDMPESLGSGGALFDYDNDGDLDIYLINGAFRNRENVVTNRLLRQEANGTFVDVTAQSGLGDTGYGMGCAVGDLDNDGDLDIYITNVGSDQLYRNNGDGTFLNITNTAGIDNPDWGCSATFTDIDRDGFLDIYVANYVKYDPAVVCSDQAGNPDYCGPGGFPGVADKLYRNNGNGTFSDISAASGIDTFPGKSLGVVSLDFNNDGFMDIYVTNDGEANLLWTNRGDGTFVDEALVKGVALNQLGYMEAGMGIAVGDADGDSDLDLFITHLRGETNTFYRNSGEFGYRDDTGSGQLAGVSLTFTGFGTGFLDFDNDGDLDLAVVNGRVTRSSLLTGRQPPAYWDHYAEPNLLFENPGDGRFKRIQSVSPFCETVENSRGLAFGDVDNDGDTDMLVMNEGGPARLYRNDAPNAGNWLMIRAVDPRLQRDMIGARITVFAGEKQLTRHVITGYSYLAASDLRVHFGLGEQNTVDKIEILWPDGTIETFAGSPVNRLSVLLKGHGTVHG